MSTGSTTVRGIGKTLAGQWSKFLIQISGTAVLARLLSPNEYGTIAMIMALIGVATLFADFGLTLASLRKPDMSRQQRSNLFWLSLLAGGAATAVIVMLSQTVAEFYNNPQLESLVAWMSLVFVFQAAVGQFRSVLAGRQLYGRIVLVDVVAQFVATAMAVYLALQGVGYWALGIQQLAFCVLQLIGLVLVSRWIPMLPRGLNKTKSEVVFGSKTAANQLLNYVSSNVDSVLLGKFWGATVLGIYNQGYVLYKMPVQQIASPLTQVVVPALSRCAEGEFKIQVLRLQVALTYVVGGVFVVLASISNEFVTLLLGPKWTDVAPIFTVLALGGVFQVLGFVYYWVFIVKDLAGRHLIFGSIARIAMVGLIVASVHLGGLGVAWAVTVGLILNWAILTLFVVPYSGIRRRIFLSSAMRPVFFLGFGFLGVQVVHYAFSDGGIIANLIAAGLVWLLGGVLSALLWKGFRKDLADIFRSVKMLLSRKLVDRF